MQYILTEAEFKQLTNEAKVQKVATDQIIANLCMNICNLQPVTISWIDEDKPWTCIRSSEFEHYCDECPVNNVCTWPAKSWSK